MKRKDKRDVLKVREVYDSTVYVNMEVMRCYMGFISPSYREANYKSDYEDLQKALHQLKVSKAMIEGLYSAGTLLGFIERTKTQIEFLCKAMFPEMVKYEVAATEDEEE